MPSTSWLRRLDFLPAWAAWALGLGAGTLAGAALAGGTPRLVGALGFLGLLGTAAALAWSGEPVAVVETKSSDIDQSVPTSKKDEGGRDTTPLLNFKIWFEPGPSGAMMVRVLSPAGEATGSFSLPEMATRPEMAMKHIEWKVDPAPDSAQQIGEALFRALFAGPVGALWARSLTMVTDRGLHLHLQLHLNTARQQAGPPLDSLPWELLYQPDTKEFLSLSRRILVSRTLTVPQPPSPMRLQTALRILVVSSNPFDTQPLDLELERQGIAEPLRDSPGIEVTFLADARLEALRQALREKEFQILHFMGHVDFNQGTGEPGLIFELEGGLLHLVSCLQLATMLADFPTLRLVFLNAARATGEVGDISVAANLVRHGVPAVIGMQFPISDRAAIEFSSTFYRSLAKGDPVDTAVTEGRRAVQMSSPPEETEWSIPALITNGYPVRLFAPRSKLWIGWKRFTRFRRKT